MKLNGFDSDNYRYFLLQDNSCFKKYNDIVYSELVSGDIVKISCKELKNNLLNSNFYRQIISVIYPFDVKEYPKDEEFDLFKYISMQENIKYKYNSVINLSYDSGEYAFIDSWMMNKLNSLSKSHRLFLKRNSGSIWEENNRIFNMIEDSEKIDVSSINFQLEDKLKNKIDGVYNQLDIKNNRAFHFSEDTSFEAEVFKEEVWPLTNLSVLLSLINQKFIHLFSNSVELLGKDKEEVFFEEYKDNIPNTNRRYYKVKSGVKVNNIYQLVGECSVDDLGCEFSSLVVRVNAPFLDTCKYNIDNYNKDGTIKYFYIDYNDSICDRIAEKEILKVATRLSFTDSLVRYRMDLEKEKQNILEKEALQYVNKHKSSYKKASRGGYITPLEFVELEKNKLQKRIVKTLENRLYLLDEGDNS